MPTREEKIAFLQSQQQAPPPAAKTREEKIAFLQSQAPQSDASTQAPLSTNDAIKKNIADMNEAGDTQNEALLDTLTAGHLPHIKAKVKQLLNGEGIANDANYVKRRDQELLDLKARADKYPGDSRLGKIVGILAPMLLTGGASGAAEAGAAGLAEAPAITGAMAEAAPAITGAAGQVAAKTAVRQGLLKSAAKGAAIGGLMGAAQNPGDTEGVVDPLQIDQRKTNAEIGAATGGVIGGAASKVPALADKINEYAEKKAFKASGAMLKDFRKAYSKDSIQDTGRFILDNKLVTAGDTVEKVAEKATTLRDATGEELGKGYDAAAKILPRLGPEAAAKVDAAGFNPVRDKDAIVQAVKNDLGHAYRGKQALQGLSDYLDQLAEQHGDQVLNPKVTNQIKSALDKTAINWERNPLAREPDAEAAVKSLRGYLGSKVSGQVQALGEVIGQTDAAKQLAALNSKYGMASKVAQIAADKMNREGANQSFGLTDKISGGAGATVGALIGAHAGPYGAALGAAAGGAIGTGANKLARSYGTAVVASTANRAGEALSKLPAASVVRQSNPALYKGLADTIGPGPNASVAATAVTADEKPPQKGEQKWVNDGLKKLLEHSDEPAVKKQIESLKGAKLDDRKLKDLLIQASDLKPGSKAMDKVLSQIQTKIAGGE